MDDVDSINVVEGVYDVKPEAKKVASSNIV